MHDLVIDNAVVIDGFGGPARESTVNEHGAVRDCGLPGHVLRDFADIG